MVRACFALPNRATHIHVELQIRIYQSHSTPQDSNDSETTFLVAPYNSIGVVFVIACSSYCFRQFLERVREDCNFSNYFWVHLLGVASLDRPYSCK